MSNYDDEFGYDFDCINDVVELPMEQAERWRAALRKLCEDAMAKNIAIDPEIISLGKYLRSKTGAPDL